MVAVFNKELLSWYLITLKLKETVEFVIPQAQYSHTCHRNLEDIPQQEHHQEQEQEQEQLLDQGNISIKEEEQQQLLDQGNTSIKEHHHHPDPADHQWVISIREKLEVARQDEVAGSSAKLCIYRIPKSLRGGGGGGDQDQDHKAYVPQIVSLGPYHHGKKRLRDMERHKYRSLRQVLKRCNHDVKLYLNSIKEVEEKARACYEGPIAMNSNEFVEMLVLDGCFILELFRGVAIGFKQLDYSHNDPVFAMRGFMHSIQRDMIMLENQLPLFILDRLMGLQVGDPLQKGIVAKLVLRFFDPLVPSDDQPSRNSDRNKLECSMGQHAKFDPLDDQSGLHFVDVFRRSLLRTGPQPTPRIWLKRRSHAVRVADKRRQQLIHCVMELKEAGIKFRRRNTDRFWDIKFENGVLQIPRILIHDGTKSLFLNLIAFEQCHLDCTNDITSYLIFMDNLINSPEDVCYLHYCGIIEHWMGSDGEVADLFNRLCQEVVFDMNESYLSQLSAQVNRYYNQRWNAWRASLKHNYFNNPWAIISFVAAVVLLMLTLAQTFYSVYGYYNPRS